MIEEKSYTAPYVLVEGPTEVEVGSTHTYTGHLIVSKVDKEAKVPVEEKGASVSVEQSFPNPGDYTVSIEIQGYTGSLSVTAGNLAVTATATPSSGAPPLSVTFSASASGGTGSYSYSWSGAVSGGSSSISKTFNDAGTYTATVAVTSGKQTASDSASVEVKKMEKCPVCERLKAEKERLKAELSQKHEKVKETKDELKDKYKRKIEIIQRLQEIGEELGGIGEERLKDYFMPGTNKWEFLLELLKVPYLAIKDIEHLQKLFTEYGELLSERKDVEDRIKELEPHHKQLEKEIKDIGKQIQDINENIASCKFPPTH